MPRDYLQHLPSFPARSHKYFAFRGCPRQSVSIQVGFFRFHYSVVVVGDLLFFHCDAPPATNPFLIDHIDEIFAPVLALSAVFLDELPDALAIFFVSEIMRQGEHHREVQLTLRASYPSANYHVL